MAHTVDTDGAQDGGSLPSNVSFTSEDEARAICRSLIASRQYWVIPWLSTKAPLVCDVIESRYYGGEKNDDLSILVLPSDPAFAVAFALKSRMTPEQFAEILSEGGSTKGKLLDNGTDVIVITESSDPAVVEMTTGAIRIWFDWIDGKRHLWGEAR